MPLTSRRSRLRRLHRFLLSDERHVDALLVVQSHTGEELFRVGGKWDRHIRRYVEGECKPHVVRLQESQLELGKAFGRWLIAAREGRKRPRVIMGGGNRGSGKTWFLAGLASVVMALEFPGDYVFGVNLAKSQKLECLEAIHDVCPPGKWIDENIEDIRDPRTVFLTGATVKWLSGQRPKGLRQAGLKIRYVLVNEGQDQPESIAINAIAAIRNTGGLVGVATNPPQNESGDWVAAWWTGIEAGELAGERYIVDNRLNRAIDQESLGDIAAFLYATNREAADADAAGIFRLAGPVAYPGFSSLPKDRGGHVGDPPNLGWKDVTLELTGSAVDSTDGFDFVCGLDFQRQPGVIGNIGKIYRDERGALVLHVIDTIGVRGVESDFSQALYAAGYRPVRGMEGLVPGKAGPTVLLVGDGTGARQNAEHRRGQPTSFVAMKADGWKIVPPMKHWRHGTAWNPMVKDSRAQMHGLFQARQVLISPNCKESAEGFPSLVESFRRAQVGPRGGLIEKGHYQHGPDGVRYLCWKFLPRPTPPKPQGLDAKSFDELLSIRVLTSG